MINETGPNLISLITRFTMELDQMPNVPLLEFSRLPENPFLGLEHSQEE